MRILQLCARIEPHPEQQERLAAACMAVTDWDGLIAAAEAQGMAPLLHRHLAAAGIHLPDHARRMLRLLCLRHRQAEAVLIKTLGSVLALLEAEGIPALVLKGAALCRTLYPEPGLRPMRDIDLLLAHKDAFPAHALLQQHGFLDPALPIPEDHPHLASLHQTVDGLHVCLELHRELFPNCPPYCEKIDFAELLQKAEAFDAAGVTAHTLATEDMLWHLYQHGFHAPLAYEPGKLVSAADLIGLVEAKTEEIDWERLACRHPQLMTALPLLHHLTPWNHKVRARIHLREAAAPAGVGGHFSGWPQRKLAEQQGGSLFKLLRDTFFPPAWWLRMYYTPSGLVARLYCSIIEHPAHVFWWVKLYWDIFLKATLPAGEKRDLISAMKHGKRIAAALYQKLNLKGMQ